MFRAILTGAFALSAAMAIVAPANAGGFAVRGKNADNVIKLQFTEADLNSVQGAKVLAGRIRLSADSVCRAEARLVPVRGPGELMECREWAIVRAVKDLNAPLVADALGRSARLPALAIR
jgi:UrcA family protein